MKKLLLSLMLVLLCSTFALAQETPGTGRFPAALDTPGSLFNTKDNSVSTLSASITSSSATITVADGSKFPTASFSIAIDSEVIYATTRTGNSITGLTRGAGGTTAASHTSGAIVRSPSLAAHHNILAAQLVAAQTKLGSTASTPSSGTMLAGTGPGTSAWQTYASLGIVTTSGGTAGTVPVFLNGTAIGNSYFKSVTGGMAIDGAGAGPHLDLYTNGSYGATDYTAGRLYADPNQIKLTAVRAGSFSSQVTSINLDSLGSTSVTQVQRDGVTHWTFELWSGYQVLSSPDALSMLGKTTAPIGRVNVLYNGGIVFYNSNNAQVGLTASALDTLTLNPSSGSAKLEFATGVYLTSGAGSPEGVVTANKGSLYSDTTNGDLYFKHTTTGNTGWVLK